MFRPRCSSKDAVEMITIFDIAFIAVCALYVLSGGLWVKMTKYKMNQNGMDRMASVPRWLQLVTWSILMAICFIRCGLFFALSAECKRYIFESRTLFFFSFLSSAIFGVFILIINCSLLRQWISTEWHSEWFLATAFLWIVHLGLLMVFYILGWNFVLHLVVETVSLWNTETIDGLGADNAFCRTRFVLFVVLFCLSVLYAICGFLEVCCLMTESNISSVRIKDDDDIILKSVPKTPSVIKNASTTARWSKMQSQSLSAIPPLPEAQRERPVSNQQSYTDLSPVYRTIFIPLSTVPIGILAIF